MSGRRGHRASLASAIAAALSCACSGSSVRSSSTSSGTARSSPRMPRASVASYRTCGCSSFVRRTMCSKARAPRVYPSAKTVPHDPQRRRPRLRGCRGGSESCAPLSSPRLRDIYGLSLAGRPPTREHPRQTARASLPSQVRGKPVRDTQGAGTPAASPNVALWNERSGPSKTRPTRRP